jgi:hypothetical protein
MELSSSRKAHNLLFCSIVLQPPHLFDPLVRLAHPLSHLNRFDEATQLAVSMTESHTPHADPHLSEHALGSKLIFSSLIGDFGGKKVGTSIWAIVVRFPK